MDKDTAIQTVLDSMTKWGFMDVLEDALTQDPETSQEDELHLALLQDALAILGGQGIEQTYFAYFVSIS